MAAPLLFYDLSLLPSSLSVGGGGDDSSNPSSSRLQLLAATARALELGFAAVALDHPHRGLLADSHRCRTDLFPPLSSLPLPPSAALHRRRLASPASEPFRQYTRITLSLDSAAAAASALAPSAARLLRTYDLIAARPLTQAAFDYLCQAPLSAHHLDLISIDFSSHSKLLFRIKLPMLKLALQKGLHFEIAYSPLISTDINAKRNLLAEVKLLVDWTKGKNLIISSAAHTASQIRGPYDVINLSAYLLGLPINRAKAAISTNCRSLVLKALRKKHFYKETIRVDRLLPNEQLTSTKFKLVDWIAGNSVSSEGGPNQLEPSNLYERPGSPIRGVMEGSHEEPHDSDVSVFSKLSEQSGDDEQIPSQTQEETLQIDKTGVLVDRGQSILSASLYYQNAVLAKARDSEVVPDPFMQAGPGSSVNPKGVTKHFEFVQDAMEVDVTEPRSLNLICAGCDNIPSTSGTSAKLACPALPHGVELSGTSLDDQGPCQSSEILANDKSCTKCHTDCAGGETLKTLVDHEIPSGSVVCPEDNDLGQPTGMQVGTETCRITSELVDWPPSGVDDEAPLDRAFYSSHKLHSNVIIRREVMGGKIEQSMDENIGRTAENETESIDEKTRTSVSMEPAFPGQEISLTSYKSSTDASCENDELKEQNSEETKASLEKSVAKTHELLPKFSYPSGKVETSTIRSEKRRRKLRPYHPAYLPFLGFLRSVHFKKKICKVRGLNG
ncbi:unnamed protein product [Urochloa humidicola]